MNQLFLLLVVIFLVLSQEGLSTSTDLTIQEVATKELQSQSYKVISQYHNTVFNTREKKQFEKDVLMFVTPWNQLGYERVLLYNKKIDYVSPVWFTTKYVQIGKQFQISFDGRQDVRQDWLNNLREVKKSMKIVPRVQIPNDQQQLLRYLTTTDGRMEFLDQLAELLNEYDFDGIVLDSVIFSYLDKVPLKFMGFVKEVKDFLQSRKKLLIISILGKQLAFGWTEKTMSELLNYSDKIIICIYDFGQRIAGMQPLAPLRWFRENIDFFYQLANTPYLKQKIMAGFPFYGNYWGEKGQEPINGAQALKYLNDGKLSYIWKDEIQECYAVTQKQEKITYPCLQFFQKRLDVLNQEYPEVGAFIWEGGQGLQYLFDIF